MSDAILARRLIPRCLVCAATAQTSLGGGIQQAGWSVKVPFGRARHPTGFHLRAGRAQPAPAKCQAPPGAGSALSFQLFPRPRSSVNWMRSPRSARNDKMEGELCGLGRWPHPTKDFFISECRLQSAMSFTIHKSPCTILRLPRRCRQLAMTKCKGTARRTYTVLLFDEIFDNFGE